MRIETEGLVIKVTDTGESDRLVTILTRDCGVIRAFANGAKKLKSRFQSATQPMSFSRFSLYQNRDSYTIDSAQGIALFFGLREDITLLSLAQYLCELTAFAAAGERDDSCAQLLRLLLNSLHLLAKQKKTTLVVKAVTEFKLLCLCGYMPDLTACAVCKSPQLDGDFVRWDLNGGTLHCASCGGGGVQIGMGVLAALRHICAAPLEKCYSFTLPEPSLRALGEATEQYSRSQLQQDFATLAFYKALL